MSIVRLHYRVHTQTECPCVVATNTRFSLFTFRQSRLPWPWRYTWAVPGGGHRSGKSPDVSPLVWSGPPAMDPWTPAVSLEGEGEGNGGKAWVLQTWQLRHSEEQSITQHIKTQILFFPNVSWSTYLHIDTGTHRTQGHTCIYMQDVSWCIQLHLNVLYTSNKQWYTR